MKTLKVFRFKNIVIVLNIIIVIIFSYLTYSIYTENNKLLRGNDINNTEIRSLTLKLQEVMKSNEEYKGQVTDLVTKFNTNNKVISKYIENYQNILVISQSIFDKMNLCVAAVTEAEIKNCKVIAQDINIKNSELSKLKEENLKLIQEIITK